MQHAPPEDDQQSVRSSKHPRSQLSRDPGSVVSSRRSRNPTEREDVRSDIQEESQSEVAKTIPIHSTGLVRPLYL